MADIFDMVDTWNDSGVVFTAIKMDVTNTASASGSKLLDLLQDGASKFSVGKTDSAGQGISITFAGNNSLIDSAGNLQLRTGNLANRDVIVNNTESLNLAGTIPLSFNADTFMQRTSVGVLDVRAGTNPVTQNIFNLTDGSGNDEYGGFNWNSNILEIRTVGTGTGTVRPVSLTPADIRMPNLPTSDPLVAGQLWNNGGTLTVSAG